MTKKKKNENYLGNNKHLPEVQKLLERYNHLNQEDDFIGSQFKTPKGGVLTIVGIGSIDRWCAKKYSCVCSICSKDIELWGNTLDRPKSFYINGCIPCACSNGKVNWTMEQNIIRVNRRCIEEDLTFIGFHGDYCGVNTKLKLKNNFTNNVWSSTKLQHFIDGHSYKRKTGLTDEEYINNFISTGLFHQETLFCNNYDGTFSYKCGACSKDEYTLSGLCSGVFKASAARLSHGSLACRCAPVVRWTFDQRKYQISKLLKSEGCKVISFPDEYKSARTCNVKWMCKEGHTVMSTIDSLLCGKRCKICSDLSAGGNGRYAGREEEKDYLYVINFNDEYIKVGRAFDLDKRINNKSSGLLKKSGMNISQIKVLAVYTHNHEHVCDTEYYIHKKLEHLGFYHKESTWTIETFHTECLSYLKQILHKSDLQIVHENGFL